MRIPYLLLFLIPITLLFACQEEVKTPVVSPKPKAISPNEDSSLFEILIFKAEQKTEIWQIKPDTLLISESTIHCKASLPVGSFNLKQIQGSNLIIEFPNQYYNHKGIKKENRTNTKIHYKDHQLWPDSSSISRVIIFPNDLKTEVSFMPCFACPHWMSELYGFLEVKLHYFRKKEIQ